MAQICAETLETGHRFRSDAFLSGACYDTESLVVVVTSPGDGVAASVVFTQVVGFRVLDEGDLLEFWPACASDQGWLFRIHHGGWFDQERARRGFIHDKGSGLGEYFIASQNDCISVLAAEAPSVTVGAL